MSDIKELAARVRKHVEHIYMRAQGIPLCDWSPMSADIVFAADALEAMEVNRDLWRDKCALVEAERDRLAGALVRTAASLAAAISLLERGGKAAKTAAPSDKMFDQMLTDYNRALDAARKALGGDE